MEWVKNKCLHEKTAQKDVLHHVRGKKAEIQETAIRECLCGSRTDHKIISCVYKMMKLSVVGMFWLLIIVQDITRQTSL